MKAQKPYFLLLIFLLASCSQEPEEHRYSSIVRGQITVDDSLDQSGDYSGIELVASIRTAENENDTLLHAVTDKDGSFSATATFPQKDIYPILISRNENTFGVINTVLAEGDTVNIQAQLPNVNETLELSSNEHEVIEIFERIERNFNRVAQFINAGALSADSVDIELKKWSDIYWDIFEKYTGSYGAKLAGETSINILRGLNDSLMVERKEELLQTYDRLLPQTRSTLLQYYAETNGLERALTFLDELKSRASQQMDKIDLEMVRIELLYDSSKTDQANQILGNFKETYSDHEIAMQWADDISYDLEFLAPGYPFPELSFLLTNGDSLHTRELTGTPFLIEITRLDNALYQQQFERTIAIYQIYRNYGLEIITVPLGATDVMLNAFFEERSQLWKVVQPNSFDSDQLIELLNLSRVPTRFLVDGDGTIIRRYVGGEYDEIVRGLQQITTENES